MQNPLERRARRSAQRPPRRAETSFLVRRRCALAARRVVACVQRAQPLADTRFEPAVGRVIERHIRHVVVSTVSRSGGSTLHGMAFYMVRDSAWSAMDPFAFAQ